MAEWSSRVSVNCLVRHELHHLTRHYPQVRCRRRDTADRLASRSQSIASDPEQHREPAVGLGPRDRDLVDPVLRTIHPGHLRSKPRLVLAGVEVAPGAPTRVVPGHRLAALRARQGRLTVVLDEHLDLLVEVDPSDWTAIVLR